MLGAGVTEEAGYCPSLRPWSVVSPNSVSFLTESRPPFGSQVQTQETTSRAALPPSYALELLTIFAWEQGCRKDTFSLAQGLRTVLALIQQHKYLCIFWTENYGFEDPEVGAFLRRQLKRPRYFLCRLPLPALLSCSLGE